MGTSFETSNESPAYIKKTRGLDRARKYSPDTMTWRARKGSAAVLSKPETNNVESQREPVATRVPSALQVHTIRVEKL